MNIIRNLFNRRKKSSQLSLKDDKPSNSFKYELSENGIKFFFTNIFNIDLSAYFSLLFENLASVLIDSEYVQIPWNVFYEHEKNLELQHIFDLAGINQQIDEVVPVLKSTSNYILKDKEFEVYLQFKNSNTGEFLKIVAHKGGAVFETAENEIIWLNGKIFKLINAINEFNSENIAIDKDIAYCEIRELLLRANGEIGSEYLASMEYVFVKKIGFSYEVIDTSVGSYVQLTPEIKYLTEVPIDLISAQAKPDVGSGTYTYFDKDADKRYKIILSPKVQNVLNTLKLKENFGIGGGAASLEDAAAFIENPATVLNEEDLNAVSLIQEKQNGCKQRLFKKAQSSEGISKEPTSEERSSSIWNFDVQPINDVIPNVKMDLNSFCIVYWIDSLDFENSVHSIETVTITIEMLDHIIAKYSEAISNNVTWFKLYSKLLHVGIDCEEKLKKLQYYRTLMLDGVNINTNNIYVVDLQDYSDRVAGIGDPPVILLPHIVKVDKPDWANELRDIKDVEFETVIGITDPISGKTCYLKMTRDMLTELKLNIENAILNGDSICRVGSLPYDFDIPYVQKLADQLSKNFEICKEHTDHNSQIKTKTLIIKHNIQTLDYNKFSRTKLLRNLEDVPYTHAIGLKESTKLLAHQIAGITNIQRLVLNKYCTGILMADDMGLGKTLQLLCVLNWYYSENKNAAASLIVVPKALIENWKNEIFLYFKENAIAYHVLHGTELKQIIHGKISVSKDVAVNNFKKGWADKACLYLTTYDTLVANEFAIVKENFSFIICDEAQSIKNPGTLKTQAAKKIKAKFRIACTGTPVENSLTDLWCLFDFIQPGLLGSLDEFHRNYIKPIELLNDNASVKMMELKEKIQPQTIRRTKESVLELPSKYYMYTKNSELMASSIKLSQDQGILVPMTEPQLGVYQSCKLELSSEGSKKISWGALHHLRMACTLVLTNKGQDIDNSCKFSWLKSVLDPISKSEDKVIIFTELKLVQQALVEFLSKNFKLNPIVLNGDTTNRVEHINKFSKKSGFDVVIMSPIATGAGLNVVSANHIVHFTRHWNPAKENQATDRAYRIGQLKSVYVYCPMAVSPGLITFDQSLNKLIHSKDNLFSTTFGEDSILQMLKPTSHIEEVECLDGLFN